MRISIHTIAKDAIRLDFHLEHMLRHHLPFADEIVVMEGYSTDNTYEKICNISPKIKVVRQAWEATDSYVDYVNRGLREATGDWCIKLDADEFIPEWEWDRLREHLAETADVILPLRLRNFYGNYRVEHTNPGRVKWPEHKWCVHPNRDDIEFWGDGSNARIVGHPVEHARGQDSFEVHHFGAVRHASRLREKWRVQAIRDRKHAGKYKGGGPTLMLPSWLFSLFPHRWEDTVFCEDLSVYEGPYMEVVKRDEAEFVRDRMKMYHMVKERAESP